MLASRKAALASPAAETATTQSPSPPTPVPTPPISALHRVRGGMASAAFPSPLPVVSLSASRRVAPTTAVPYHLLLHFSRRSGLSSGSASVSCTRLRVQASKADPVEERIPAAPDLVAEPQPQVRTSTWKWRGYNIRYQYAGTSGPALVLIHGFGANSDHWWKNIHVLAMANRVYAIDLIGYGYSDKPNPRELGESFYSFETWGEQLNTFCVEVVKSEAFFICNSIRASTLQ